MTKRFKKLFSVAHGILLSVSLGLVLSGVIVYIHESNLDFDDFMIYYYVMPEKEKFDDGDVIKYYSVSQSVNDRVIDRIEWNELTRCIFPGQSGLSYFDDASSEAHQYVSKSKPAQATIDFIEISEKKENLMNKKDEQTLREMLSLNDTINPWRLSIDNPESGSTCFTRHIITIYTDLLGLEVSKEIISSPFVYGNSKEN